MCPIPSLLHHSCGRLQLQSLAVSNLTQWTKPEALFLWLYAGNESRICLREHLGNVLMARHTGHTGREDTLLERSERALTHRALTQYC